jgi:serine protease Do
MSALRKTAPNAAGIRLVLLGCVSFVLTACVSTQPESLTPSISMSSEAINLSTETTNTQGYDFGLSAVLNESDSLSNIEILPGVRVRAVTDNAAAARAGIRVGDVILQVDGNDVNQPDTLDAIALQGSAQEKSFNFVLRRNTSVLQATVNARRFDANRAAPIELYRADPIATRAGFTTQLLEINAEGNNSGAKVVRFFPGSPLPDADIRQDDIIISLNGEALESAQDLITRVNTEHDLGSKVTLGILRQTNGQTVSLEKSLRLWSPGRRISGISLGPILQYSNSLSPAKTEISIGDFWLFSLFDYSHSEGEKQYGLFSLLRFSSGYGQLVEESNP